MTRRAFSTAMAVAAASASAQTSGLRPLMRLRSNVATAAFDLLGGGLIEFQFLASPLNPLTWEQSGGPKESRPRGHFLCMDRWGQPSEAELKNGMPFHGEASHVEWKQPGAGKMEALLPMAQLHVERTAALQGATLTVREKVTNRNKLGRIYNMVQHPSIAPPFLDVDTVVDANAKSGFAQSAPDVLLPDGVRTVRELKSNPDPNVASFAIEDEEGWVSALSRKHKLALTYVWETSHYPWLNLWRHVQDGRPVARGLEFGTTGLHQPFPELVKRGRMLQKPLYAYLDAGETQERSYRAFLSKVPDGATGVSSATVNSSGEGAIQFIS